VPQPMAPCAVATVPSQWAVPLPRRFVSRAVSSRAARFRPCATNDDPPPRQTIQLTFVRPSSDDPDDVVETKCVASAGENLLACAMRCGAVDDGAHFCLEGRCDSCLFENTVNGETVRGCQTTVDGETVGMRLWIGGEADPFAIDDDW
jgi:hypothetical protein